MTHTQSQAGPLPWSDEEIAEYRLRKYQEELAAANAELERLRAELIDIYGTAINNDDRIPDSWVTRYDELSVAQERAWQDDE